MKNFGYVTFPSLLMDVFASNVIDKIIKGLKDNLAVAGQATAIPSVIQK